MYNNASPSTMIPFMITVTLMTVMFIFGLIVILISLKNKQTKRRREYLKALVDEKERTMYLISLEVHDNVNQMLNMARMNLHWLKNNPTGDNLTLIKDTGSIIDTLIMDTNNISHTLNTDYLKKKGLVSSLREEAMWVNNSKKIKCDVHIGGITKKFDPQIEIMIFRIAQEAIQNAIKHAEADAIEIKLIYQDDNFEMWIEDNGKGFDSEFDDYSESIGMMSMRQRAKIVEGNLNVRSATGKGTVVCLQIVYLK
jgi:two-component system, NarL family, sensor kinase